MKRNIIFQQTSMTWGFKMLVLKGDVSLKIPENQLFPPQLFFPEHPPTPKICVDMYLDIPPKNHHWVVVSNIFWNFHPEIWGNDPIWRAHFSKGAKPPTRSSNIAGWKMDPDWRCIYIYSSQLLLVYQRVSPPKNHHQQHPQTKKTHGPPEVPWTSLRSGWRAQYLRWSQPFLKEWPTDIRNVEVSNKSIQKYMWCININIYNMILYID